jgi:dTDP-glucose pyrophosphorylase
MEEKKCNFCEKSKKKFSKYTVIGLYLLTLMIWGQIDMIKYIIKLLGF